MSQGVHKLQHIDNSKVYEENMDTQGKEIYSKVQQSVAKHIGVIERENIDKPVLVVVEKIKVNSNVDQMVR